MRGGVSLRAKLSPKPRNRKAIRGFRTILSIVGEGAGQPGGETPASAGYAGSSRLLKLQSPPPAFHRRLQATPAILCAPPGESRQIICWHKRDLAATSLGSAPATSLANDRKAHIHHESCIAASARKMTGPSLVRVVEEVAKRCQPHDASPSAALMPCSVRERKSSSRRTSAARSEGRRKGSSFFYRSPSNHSSGVESPRCDTGWKLERMKRRVAAATVRRYHQAIVKAFKIVTALQTARRPRPMAMLRSGCNPAPGEVPHASPYHRFACLRATFIGRAEQVDGILSAAVTSVSFHAEAGEAAGRRSVVWALGADPGIRAAFETASTFATAGDRRVGVVE